MLFGKLSFLFEVMIYVGLGLPLVNVLLGLFGGLVNSGGEVSGDLSADTDLSFDVEAGPDLDLDLDLDVDLDLDLDGGGADLGAAEGVAAAGGQKGVLIRFDVYCLCLAFVVMGAVGIYSLEMLSGLTRILTLLVGFGLAVLAYCLLYRLLILPLKRNKSSALSTKSLPFRHARVTFRILRDSPGKIQTKDAVGAIISYQAELDPQICKVDRIDEGEEVLITEVDQARNLCYVMLTQHKLLK